MNYNTLLAGVQRIETFASVNMDSDDATGSDIENNPQKSD
jgi:hypothetical protein